MTTRGEIVTEARAWLDTPFAHQGHARGLGTDCGGFIAGVGIGAGVFPPDSWATIFSDIAGYARTPSGGMLEGICRRHLISIALDDAGEGDVVIMRFAEEPQHLAILAPYLYGGLSMIHAYSRAVPPRVVEHRYADVWRARAVEAFAYPGVT